jgi:hypothetical protein
MKVIYPNNVTDATADEEDANYPAANVLNEHPRKVWKGTSVDAVLSISVSAGSAVAVFNTNAESVSVEISAGLTLDWTTELTWGTQLTWPDSETIESLINISPSSVGTIWAEYAERSSSHLLTISLTAAAGETIQAGIVQAGTRNEFESPMIGIKEGLKDFSIVRELSNGAIYTRKRDVVRTFEFDVWEDRNVDFYTFLHTIMQQRGPAALAWWLAYDADSDGRWIVYCRPDGGMPTGSHELPAYSKINVKLIEVI